ARMFDEAFAGPLPAAVKPHTLPEAVDHLSYARGRLGDIASVRFGKGFVLEPMWKPADGKGTRAGFVNVPALVGTGAGAEMEFEFDGQGVGLFITSGPDAGRIEFQIDGGPARTLDTSTRWSARLHLPWAVILDDGLEPGRHRVKVRIVAGDAPTADPPALRVFQLLLN
ncbi:MAG: hypothetical protein KDB14_18045, partial [Planctomycetales bacterium]|nr:hypothetical protein [Planctomycetales bacterium]